MGLNDFDAGTWTCHVCKDERPDQFISVLRKPLKGADGSISRMITENIRYCNDRPRCRAEARHVSHLRTWR